MKKFIKYFVVRKILKLHESLSLTWEMYAAKKHQIPAEKLFIHATNDLLIILKFRKTLL